MIVPRASKESCIPEPCFVKTFQGRRRDQLCVVVASVASVVLLLGSLYFLNHQCHSPFINNIGVKLTGFSLGAAGTTFFATKLIVEKTTSEAVIPEDASASEE